jgi:hypothetical protein
MPVSEAVSLFGRINSEFAISLIHISSDLHHTFMNYVVSFRIFLLWFPKSPPGLNYYFPIIVNIEGSGLK